MCSSWKTVLKSPLSSEPRAGSSEGLMVQARWGYPEDIGKAVAALARGDFAYSTGQVVIVDGGMTLQRL